MVKLFSKNPNLCDHNSPTSQTDRRTTCDRNTALCTKVHRALKTTKTASVSTFISWPSLINYCFSVWSFLVVATCYLDRLIECHRSARNLPDPCEISGVVFVVSSRRFWPGYCYDAIEEFSTALKWIVCTAGRPVCGCHDGERWSSRLLPGVVPSTRRQSGRRAQRRR